MHYRSTRNLSGVGGSATEEAATQLSSRGSRRSFVVKHFWFLSLVMAVLVLGLHAETAAAKPYNSSHQQLFFGGHHLTKRSFFDIQCKGVYAKLDGICEDCYNLFREPQLHLFCR